MEEKVMLYITSVDISHERGPGINEREFVFGLNHFFGDRVHCLIPKPVNNLESIKELNGSVTYYARNNFRNPFSFLKHTLSQFSSFLSLQKKYNYSLIIFRLDLFPLGAFLISMFTKIPYYIKTLEFFDYFVTQKGVKGVLGRIAYPISGYMHKKLADSAIAVDVCTEQFIEYFHRRLKLDKEKMNYIDNATNVNRFMPIDKDNAKAKTGLEKFDSIVGFVGGRPLERGGKQLIKMAQFMTEKFENIGFVVVGGNEYEVQKLNQEAERLGVSNYCVFTGAVAYEEVVFYINAFDLCVAFDLTDRTALFGNASQKIRQYVACGKPVIAGKGGNEFLKTENLGSIVDPDNIAEIIEAAIYWLSLDSQGKRAHSEKAYQYACKNLSVESALEKRIIIWNTYLDLADDI